MKPARDEKGLTGWNGLMLAAFAEAAWVLEREDYRSVAERNADFILRELQDAPERTRSATTAESKMEPNDTAPVISNLLSSVPLRNFLPDALMGSGAN